MSWGQTCTPTPSRQSLRSTSRREVAIWIALSGACILLSGCAILNLHSDSRAGAPKITAQAFQRAQSCLAAKANHFTDKEEALGPSLGPCINVYLLDKTDQEIQEEFRPSGSGTYVMKASPGGTQVALDLLTVGNGQAIAGPYSDTYRIVMCWSVSADLAGAEISVPVDATCPDLLMDIWHPDEVVTIEELAEITTQ